MDETAMSFDVPSWLSDIGLSAYAEAFAEHAIEADVLPSLTAHDLRDIGVTKVGDRRRLLTAIAALGTSAETGASSSPAPEPPTAAPTEPPLAGAERRQLTIVVCDIVDSTELTTELDPEEMRDLIARFQRYCADAIRKVGGYVGPFLGDGMIAYFGFPRTLENDAESALRAGLAIVRRLHDATDLARPLDVRVGVASGTVVVGRLDDPGSPAEQTVIGDTPALASRLQTLAAPGTVVCGSITRQLAGDLFRFEPKGRIAVKGFAQPVIVFEVLSESDIETRFAATRVATIARMIGRTLERNLILERWAMAERGEGQSADFTHSLTLANLLILELMQHCTDRTAQLLDELRRIALARGAPFWVDLVGYHEGMALVALGDLDPGIAKMTRALDTFAANSVEVEIPFYQAMLAEVLLAADRPAEAQTLLDDALARVIRTQERWPLAEILRLQITCATQEGDHTTAQRWLADARRVCTEQAATTWADRLEETARKLGLVEAPLAAD